MDVRGEEKLFLPEKTASHGTLYLISFSFLVPVCLVISLIFFISEPSDLALLKARLIKAGFLSNSQSYAGLYESFGVAPLPVDIELNAEVANSLAKLQREHCDKRAVFALQTKLVALGEDRLAANMLVGFASKCQDGVGELRQAANLFFKLGDSERALAMSSSLVAATPTDANMWYLKAKAEKALGRLDQAILSYANTIHYQENEKSVGQWVFTEMAEAYAADHRYCEAIGPLELYVSLDPATRDVPKIKKLIEDYSKQGKCTDFAKGGDSFPIVGTGLIPVRVSINGVMGNFLLDTGASFVTVTSGFAQRAGLSTTNSTITRSMTANGAVFDKIATARMITVGHARAHDVPVLVQDRPLDGQDGLLGRSFLTRFDVKISASRWELTQKK